MCSSQGTSAGIKEGTCLCKCTTSFLPPRPLWCPVFSTEVPSQSPGARHSEQVPKPALQQPPRTIAVLIQRKLHPGVFIMVNKETRHLRQKIELYRVTYHSQNQKSFSYCTTEHDHQNRNGKWNQRNFLGRKIRFNVLQSSWLSGLLITCNVSLTPFCTFIRIFSIENPLLLSVA